MNRAPAKYVTVSEPPVPGGFYILSTHTGNRRLVDPGKAVKVVGRKLQNTVRDRSSVIVGPVFGPDGEVIGVNFAILRDFQDSNFGVPIRYVRPLLP